MEINTFKLITYERCVAQLKFKNIRILHSKKHKMTLCLNLIFFRETFRKFMFKYGKDYHFRIFTPIWALFS